MMKTYRPISCSFYDELEALATLKTPCTIRFRVHDTIVDTLARIVDFKILSDGEHMILDNGNTIRLDLIISVNDKYLEDYERGYRC